MQEPFQKKISILFWVIAAAEIISIITVNPVLHFIAKPLLLTVLFILLYTTNSAVPGKYILLAGLFFSWIGDVLLMFDSWNDLFFILGLVSFLTTHIFYIVYFLRIISSNTSLLKKKPVLVAIVLAYGITLVWQLFPKLGDMKLPVIAYAFVICGMMICSLHVYNKINKKSAILFVVGAAAFVISDSILAFNKFYQPFTNAGVLIMLTYCLAQYLIVCGYIEQES